MIYKLREQEYSYRRISRYLNEKCYKSTRGEQFTPSLVFEIIKKNKKRNQRHKNEYKVELTDFDLDIK